MSMARYLEADRSQLRWDMVDSDSQLPRDHRARIVWSFVEGLDLSAFCARFRAREDGAGRPPPDPKIMLSLWLYATLEDIGSARAVDRACASDTAFRRLCGGTKVSAAAGRGSFVGVSHYAAVARARVRRLRAELEAGPAVSERRTRAAQARAAKEMVARARQARAMPERLRHEKEEAAKTHKTAAAGKAGRKVSTTGRRNDTGLAEPMVEQLARRYGQVPSRPVLDGKIATLDEIVAFAGHPKGRVEVYAPVGEERADITRESRRKRDWRRAREPAAITAWRARMATPEGDAAMRRRRGVETINAILKSRGMRRMRVRGKIKAHCRVLLQALANNLMQAHRLRTA